jgi:hypothetical protein
VEGRFSFSKMMDSNLPAPTSVVKIALKCASVLSMGTLTRKRLRASLGVGIFGSWCLMYRQWVALTGNDGKGGIDIGRMTYSPKLGGSFDIL